MRYLVEFTDVNGQPDEQVVEAHTPHSAIGKTVLAVGVLTDPRVYAEGEF